MRFLLCTFVLGLLPATRFFAFKRLLLTACGVSVGEGTNVCGRVAFFGAGKVVLGRDCWIGIGARFYTAGDASIVIGDRCDIAPEVTFTCGSHEVGDASRRAKQPGTAHSIRIGSGTWIGHRATVLGGCEVGSGCVIGSAALILGREYPADSRIVGVPGKVQPILRA